MKTYVLLLLLLFFLSCEPSHKGNSHAKQVLAILQKTKLQNIDSQPHNPKISHQTKEEIVNASISRMVHIPDLEINKHCKNAKAILSEIQSFVNQKNELNQKHILQLFIQNEKEKSHCYFSDDEIELSIIYLFIDELVARAEGRREIIEFIIHLDNILIINVEISEYLSFDVLPQLAMKDTKTFIEALFLVKKEMRDNVIDDLVFPSKEQEQKFLEQLNSYAKLNK